MTRTLRHPIALALVALVLLFLVGSTFTVVPENKQAVILRMGQPEGVVNAYGSGSSAGLIARIPFVDRIVWLDRRLLSLDSEDQPVVSSDQHELQVDAVARYRIVDPMRAYLAAGSEDNLAGNLRPLLGAALRSELSHRSFDELLNPDRGAILAHVRDTLNRAAGHYGLQIVDVRVLHADLPDGAPTEQAYQRMRSASGERASAIRLQGYHDAQAVRSQADGRAAQIYAQAFQQDPAFYDFYRAMQSYQTSFIEPPAPLQGQTEAPPTPRRSIILTPENDYLRQFRQPH